MSEQYQEELRLRLEKNIRVGEVLMMLATVIGLISGWFVLQTQVQANTETIRGNIRLIEQLRDDVRIIRETQIRIDSYNAGKEAGERDGESR